MCTGEEEEVGPDSLVDEEASSNSRGIGGGGSGQAAVSGGTGFQIFKFYHTLCHFFVVTDFFCLQERRRRLDQTLRKMKRPQVAEELEEEEVDKLLFLEVLVFKFSNFTTDFVIFLWLLTFLRLLFVYRRGGGGRTRLFGR